MCETDYIMWNQQGPTIAGMQTCTYTTAGQKNVLMMVKQIGNNSKYIYQSKVIKYEEERVLVEELKILAR